MSRLKILKHPETGQIINTVSSLKEWGHPDKVCLVKDCQSKSLNAFAICGKHIRILEEVKEIENVHVGGIYP